MGHEQAEVGSLGHRRRPQLRRVVALRSQQAESGTPLRDQLDHVLVLGDQAFEFEIGVALLQFGQTCLVLRRLVGIRKHQADPRFQPAGQLSRRVLQAVGGSEDFLDAANQDAAGIGQLRLAVAAIEKLQAQVDLQPGYGFADGGLALAQLACGGTEGAEGDRLGKSFEGFGRVVHIGFPDGISLNPIPSTDENTGPSPDTWRSP
ncbi:hypothetical protein D3C85_814960 [compost metagenome]